MNQGVTHSLKEKYHLLVVQNYIRALDEHNPLPNISIISAFNMLVTAWSMVIKSNLINCFTKAEVSETLKTKALQDEDDPFQDLVAEMETIREKDQDLVPAAATTEEFILVDDYLITTTSLVAEEDIIAEFRGC